MHITAFFLDYSRVSLSQVSSLTGELITTKAIVALTKFSHSFCLYRSVHMSQAKQVMIKKQTRVLENRLDQVSKNPFL